MRHEDRKAALTAYKERKVTAGIFALRCAASGQCWVGDAPDLSTIWNRLSFSLRMRSGMRPALQQAWDKHGEADFRFEVLETTKPDEARKEKLGAWCETLGAEPI